MKRLLFSLILLFGFIGMTKANEDGSKRRKADAKFNITSKIIKLVPIDIDKKKCVCDTLTNLAVSDIGNGYVSISWQNNPNNNGSELYYTWGALYRNGSVTSNPYNPYTYQSAVILKSVGGAFTVRSFCSGDSGGCQSSARTINF